MSKVYEVPVLKIAGFDKEYVITATGRSATAVGEETLNDRGVTSINKFTWDQLTIVG